MRVLIDCDPGLGKRGADIDDGLALFVMLNNPNTFEIEGITTVFGNTPVRRGYKLLKKYLNLLNKQNIPHFMGAQSKSELGKSTKASEFIVEKVYNNPNDLILIILGPLTNISTAYKNYPALFDNLKKIVFMGGNLKPTNAFSERFKIFDDFFKTEFNLYQDADAAKIFIENRTETPRIGFGLDICCKAIFKKIHLKKIKESRNPVAKFILEDLKYWLNLWQYNKSKGFYPFDTFVPIYLMNPSLFELKSFSLEVDNTKILGRLIKKMDTNQNGNSLKYCIDFKKEEYKETFIEILIENLIK
ncbi:MAG: hypothetical protein GF317_19125 [Candidatus Lokiarchaeota archaeon]|nr:hypothetical protein [Candidatus Lokiarchaeota archaeon]MBD3201625.1 hypothetical protein [Candidatus Lokiarchaeota archaeon]